MPTAAGSSRRIAAIGCGPGSCAWPTARCIVPSCRASPASSRSRGHTFHTSRWDYDYTGGDSDGNLTGLAGKRVGIIGTGATAVQCVPHLGEAAEQLYVFQRTPSSIDVRDNRPTDPEWIASLQPGWQKRRMENFNNLVSGVLEPEDLVNDGWTDIIGKLLIRLQRGEGGDMSADSLARTMEMADFEKMEQIRARVDAMVADPLTAEALKPYYRQFCKRPCFHDDYLDAFNRPNVTLVDTQGRGVERITERGVVVDGVEYELDCIIYATGFEVGTEYTRRAGYELVGRDGQTLTEKWADGVSTLHGLHSRGFPNCFIFSLAQSGFTVNFPHMLDEQSKHVAYILSHAKQHGITRDRGRRRGRGGVGADDRRARPVQPELPRVVHARLLQQRGQAGRAQPEEHELRRRLGRLHQGPRELARRGRPRRPGAHEVLGRHTPSARSSTRFVSP